MGIRDRSSKRRKQILAHRASSFQDAEKWDLEFWQCQTPEQRLSALVAIRRDVMKVQQARMKNEASEKKDGVFRCVDVTATLQGLLGYPGPNILVTFKS